MQRAQELSSDQFETQASDEWDWRGYTKRYEPNQLMQKDSSNYPPENKSDTGSTTSFESNYAQHGSLLSVKSSTGI
ncbi:hypothetical protein FRC06_008694, partial [Ceratobasidium sp. 370]